MKNNGINCALVERIKYLIGKGFNIDQVSVIYNRDSLIEKTNAENVFEAKILEKEALGYKRAGRAFVNKYSRVQLLKM